MDDKYKIIEDSELKIDKELKEVQKTIIYYGEKIKEEINTLKTLIDINIHKQYKTVKETEKGKDIIVHEDCKNPIIKHIAQMKIPEGYKK